MKAVTYIFFYFYPHLIINKVGFEVWCDIDTFTSKNLLIIPSPGETRLTKTKNMTRKRFWCVRG